MRFGWEDNSSDCDKDILPECYIMLLLWTEDGYWIILSNMFSTISLNLLTPKS
jgi:hypothetical protein